jgi:thymidine phosphorylase
MDQPLGRAVGNFLEVEESIECLRGGGPPDEVDLTCRLAGWMLTLGGVSSTADAGEALARQRLADGSAWDRFVRNVEFQGGDVQVVLHPDRGPRASITRSLRAAEAGVVRRIDAYPVGIASVVLGAGRSRMEDLVRPGVGITLGRLPGDRVDAGDELCLVHGDEESRVEEARRLMASAYEIGESPAPRGGRVLEEIVA